MTLRARLLLGASVESRPAEDGRDPRHQLLEAEGLDEVVVPAEREAAHLVLGGVSGGEEEHRRPVTGGAQALAHVEAVEVGEHHVEHDEIRLHRRHGGDGLTAVGDGVDVEPGVAEGCLEHRAQVVLVVDEQQAGRGHRSSMAPLTEHWL